MTETATLSVLIADITGSTELYSRLGDVEAQRLVAATVGRLRSIVAASGGRFIAQKGDDVLASFERPADAFAAAGAMLRGGGGASGGALPIHAGVSFGRVVLAGGDVFGETVNVASRLCGLASRDEVCFSGDFVARLDPPLAAALRPLGAFEIRGLPHPIDVFSLREAGVDGMTEMGRTMIAAPSRRREGVTATALLVTHRGRSLACPSGRSLVVGRSEECDLVLPHGWVSRRHAVFTVQEGRATLADKSSLGTFVQAEGGREVMIHREALILPPRGIVSPAVSVTRPEAEPIAFEIV